MAIGSLNKTPFFGALSQGLPLTTEQVPPQAFQGQAAPGGLPNTAQLAEQRATTIGLPQGGVGKAFAAPAEAPSADNLVAPLMKMLSSPQGGLALLFVALFAAAQGQSKAGAPTSAPEGGSGPSSAPTSAPTTSAPDSKPGGKEPVFVIGSAVNAGGMSVRDYIYTFTTGDWAQYDVGANRGAAEALRNFAATASEEALNQTVPNGSSLVISQGGKLVGTVPTTNVMANPTLGVQTHAQSMSVTMNTGGSLKDDSGKEHDVKATLLVSPIALDLNNDGEIGTTGVSTAKDRKALAGDQVGKTVSFDIDADGKQDNIEWLHGEGDGMLVDDADGGATKAMNSDGKIDGSRLFGDQGGKFANGYQKLARHDKNGDGKLTGKELEGLKVWTDKGSDARVGKGELKSLKDLGITELDVTVKTEKNTRGEDLMRSSFVQNGQKKMTEDVWFAQK